MTTLFGLIHVSDLHLGDNLYPNLTPKSHSGPLNSSVQQLEIHDLQALEALSNSVLWMYQNNKFPISIIVTGDLTTFATRPAFHFASDFLGGSINLLGTQQSGLKGKQQIGFNKTGTLVVPGNHDIWGKATTNVLSSVSSTLSSRTEFDKHFSNGFPYRQKLYASPLIYLYCLDSTRLEAYAAQSSQGSLSDGFVDRQQLADLEALVKKESRIPALRIAALHHSPIRPQHGVLTLPKGELFEHNDLLHRLHQLGFAIVLCGHLHEGFAEPANQSSPINILAAGNSAQKVNLSPGEKNALRQFSFLLNMNDRKLRASAIRRTNEYRMYEFVQGQNSLTLKIHTYVYVPGFAAFDEKVAPTSINL